MWCGGRPRCLKFCASSNRWCGFVVELLSKSPFQLKFHRLEQIIKLNKLHVTPVNFSLDAELKYGEPSKVYVFFLDWTKNTHFA